MLVQDTPGRVIAVLTLPEDKSLKTLNSENRFQEYLTQLALLTISHNTYARGIKMNKGLMMLGDAKIQTQEDSCLSRKITVLQVLGKGHTAVLVCWLMKDLMKAAPPTTPPLSSAPTYFC